MTTIKMTTIAERSRLIKIQAEAAARSGGS
jgi:hypothetical protein